MYLCSIDWEVHLPSIYMHCPRFSNGCSSMQGIYACLTGGSNCLLYIGIVRDLVVGVVVCKASMLEWLGVHLSSICMHCPRSSSGCSSMQGICSQFSGEDLCWIALCYANIFGAAVFNASMLAWLRESICLLYMCIVLDLSVGVVVCKASVLNWLREGHMKWNGIQGI